MDIKSVSNESLIAQVIKMAIEFGDRPSEKLSNQIKIGEEEILRRLETYKNEKGN